MKWTINLVNIKDKEIQFVLDYCKDWLSEFDTSKLDEVRINNGRQKKWDPTFYGHCSYPWKNIKQYKIVCHINNDIVFPLKRQQRRSPLYFMKNDVEIKGAHEAFKEMEKNKQFELGAHVYSKGPKGLTKWVRVYELEIYKSFDECIAAIFGHEIGHFLSKTKQIKVHNTEIEIDKFEDKFLEEYKKYKSQFMPS